MHESHTKYRSAFTLVEMILVIGMMAVIQHMTRILRQAKAVIDVSESTDQAGFITFTGVNNNTEEFRLNTTTGELSYGDPNALDVLVAPVSSLVFTCYDLQLQLLTGPFAGEGQQDDPQDIRTVAFEATFVDPADGAMTVSLSGRVFLPTTAAAEDTTGGVLFVVADAASLTAQETVRKNLVESFGFTVSLISDDASQAVFDAAVADADVAYVSGDIDSIALGTKLTAATIGVVNEEGDSADELGLGDGPQTNEFIRISVVDNTHYITQGFSTGFLDILPSNQPLQALKGGVADGIEELAQVWITGANYDPGLLVLETGAALYGGGTAAGRRVQLPWGSTGFDINPLLDNGKTILQRSIEWAAASVVAPQTVLLVVGDAASPSTRDLGRKSLMEGWDFTVNLIDDGDTQANYDTAAAAADVVYVAGTASGASILDKLTGSPTPIVNEVNGKLDNFGFCSSTASTFSADTFSISDAAHDISSPFGGSAINVLTTFLSMPIPGGTLAPDLQFPASFTGFERGVVTLDMGAERYDGKPAPARRVHLPFAPAEVSQLTADAQTIMRRAIEWAAAGSGGGAPDPEMYVHDITMAWRKQGPRYYGQATVWVKDADGDNVEGATVNGTWSGSVSGSDTGDTAADGTVMAESAGVNGGGTYIFTVDSITKTGYSYNSALDVESSGMIVAP